MCTVAFRPDCAPCERLPVELWSGLPWRILQIPAFDQMSVPRQVEIAGRHTATKTPNLASQIRVAFSSIALNTGSSSPGELEMTCSTSEVAVCCSSDSVRSSVRWRSSLSRRVFSMAMTAWAAKFSDQLDLLVGKRPDLLAVNDDGAEQLVFLEHRHDDVGSRACASSETMRFWPSR